MSFSSEEASFPDFRSSFETRCALPVFPQMFNPAFDSGDHLHPNDAGYQAMADAVNLNRLVEP